MAVITDRKKSIEIVEKFRDKKVSIAIFCTASHWNTEAILLAASRFAKKHDMEKIPLSVAMTVNYPYMPQAAKVTYSRNLKAGFISNMEHLRALCAAEDSPYYNVQALPHLDHADPALNEWFLTEGTSYLSSVMFDAQKYPLEKNISMTKDYIKEYGDKVLVEGIMDELTVEGSHEGKSDSNYVEKATLYCSETGIDFLVADLGTEQQSSGTGKCEYLGNRARDLTENLDKSMLVLHGTSCLTPDQMTTLSDDGIIRVNMWTRIARESGQHAAAKLMDRMDKIQNNDFEATESMQYLYDSIEKAADIMEETLGILGYDKLAK